MRNPTHQHELLQYSRPPDKENYYFSYFLTKTYVVGTQKNRLDETVLLSNLMAKNHNFTQMFLLNWPYAVQQA